MLVSFELINVSGMHCVRFRKMLKIMYLALKLENRQYNAVLFEKWWVGHSILQVIKWNVKVQNWNVCWCIDNWHHQGLLFDRLSFQFFSGSFGIYLNEPMQSCFVHRVPFSLLSPLVFVHSCPSDRFKGTNFVLGTPHTDTHIQTGRHTETNTHTCTYRHTCIHRDTQKHIHTCC